MITRIRNLDIRNLFPAPENMAIVGRYTLPVPDELPVPVAWPPRPDGSQPPSAARITFEPRFW